MPYTFTGSQILKSPADALPSGSSPRTIAFTMNAVVPQGNVCFCYGTPNYGKLLVMAVGMSPSSNLNYTQFGDGDQIDFDCIDGADHRYVLVVDGTNVVMYANGTSHRKPIASLYAGLNTVVSGTSVYVGGWMLGGGFFMGSLSELVVYDAALVGDDLTTVIAGSSVPGTPLCHWPLADGDLANYGSLGSDYDLISPYGGGNPFDSQVFQGVAS
jgi:hypothetical protein